MSREKLAPGRFIAAINKIPSVFTDIALLQISMKSIYEKLEKRAARITILR
jgi:hypothetical protein